MIDEYLIRIENYLKDIKQIVEGLSGRKIENIPAIIEKLDLPVSPRQSINLLDSFELDKPQPIAPQPEEVMTPYLVELNQLKGLLESPEWVEAADPKLICDETKLEDKKLRIEGIMDFMIDDSLEGKKFLDFGCGEGLGLDEAIKRGAKLSVGYDIVDHWHKNFSGKSWATGDWHEVIDHGPYDYVFIYDVLDHIIGSNSNPVSVLQSISRVCHPDTIVRVRCHPWCSRSGTHAYRSLNKAFIHLVFTDVELVRMGVVGSYPTEKIIHPHLTYKNWFEDGKFEIIKEEPISEDFSKFFSENPLISERIKNTDTRTAYSARGQIFFSRKAKHF